MAATEYYVRVRNRVTGPFDQDQLLSLHKRGLLSPIHEISTDGVTWEPFDSLDGILGDSKETPDEPIREKEDEKEEWYYGDGRLKKGPFTDTAFREMVANGMLSPDTLVYREGFGNWKPLRELGLARGSGQRRKGRFPLRKIAIGIAGAVCLALLVLGVIYLWPREMSEEQIHKYATPSIAHVEGNHSSGTGFLVREDVLATNAHVISRQFIKNVSVHFKDPKNNSVTTPNNLKVIYFNPKSDLALLKLDIKRKPLEVHPSYKIRSGQRIVTVGFPVTSNHEALTNSITSGLMSSEKTIGELVFFQLNMSVNPGNSGGPVLDERGRVIGVIALKDMGKDQLSYAIPADSLLKAIEKAKKAEDADIEEVASRHRASVAFYYLNRVCYPFLEELESSVKEYEDKSKTKSGQNPPPLREIFLRKLNDREDSKEILADIKIYTEEVKTSFDAINSDPNCPEPSRRRLNELNELFIEIAQIIADKNSNFSTTADAKKLIKNCLGAITQLRADFSQASTK